MQFLVFATHKMNLTHFGSAAAISAIYPFFSDSHAWLLVMVVFLGMFSGLVIPACQQISSQELGGSDPGCASHWPAPALSYQQLCGAVAVPSLTKEAHGPAIAHAIMHRKRPGTLLSAGHVWLLVHSLATQSLWSCVAPHKSVLRADPFPELQIDASRTIQDMSAVGPSSC